MDEAASRHVRELLDAISAALAADPEVRACRARAKAAGFDINVSIEAQIRALDEAKPPVAPADAIQQARPLLPAVRTFEVTAADRRFLRSLRIAADPAREPVE